MPDMLVRLYDLPADGPDLARLAANNIHIRRAQAKDADALVAWVAADYPGWEAELRQGLASDPMRCFVALDQNGDPCGFACHDVTAPTYFGPTAVRSAFRGQGIGRALLLAALQAIRDQGYAYAIIGGVGPAEFYEKAVDALLIPKSTPGIYGTRQD